MKFVSLSWYRGGYFAMKSKKKERTFYGGILNVCCGFTDLKTDVIKVTIKGRFMHENSPVIGTWAMFQAKPRQILKQRH